jgi:hypothetical protein
MISESRIRLQVICNALARFIEKRIDLIEGARGRVVESVATVTFICSRTSGADGGLRAVVRQKPMWLD